MKYYAVMWGGCRVLADSLALMWNEDAWILKNLLKGYDMTIKFDCVKGSFIDSILFNGLANESNHELRAWVNYCMIWPKKTKEL